MKAPLTSSQLSAADREDALRAGQALGRIQDVDLRIYHLYRLPVFHRQADLGWDCAYVKKTFELSAHQNQELREQLEKLREDLDTVLAYLD